MEFFNEYKKVNTKESDRMLENGEVEEQHMEKLARQICTL
jgi:hypothetical protein